MEPSEIARALASAAAVATKHGLTVDDAVVLQNANRIAVRLLPCDTLVRIAPAIGRAEEVAAFEVEVARQFDEATSPVAVVEPRMEPRIYLRDGFAVTFWKYYETAPGGDITPAEYARALEHLHASMRDVDIAAPHFSARVVEALAIVDDPSRSPRLVHTDRVFLGGSIRALQQTILESGAKEQLIHCEPHPGNLLRTYSGIRFIDLETCSVGPIEFDIAHAPIEVGPHYTLADKRLLRLCRILSLSLVASWRADRRDQYPDGQKMLDELIRTIRNAMDRHHGGTPLRS